LTKEIEIFSGIHTHTLEAIMLIDIHNYHILWANEACYNLYEIEDKESCLNKPFYEVSKSNIRDILIKEKEKIKLILKKKGAFSSKVELQTINKTSFFGALSIVSITLLQKKYFSVKVRKIEKEVKKKPVEKVISELTLKADLANEANILLEKEITKHQITQSKLFNSQEISNSVFNSSLDIIISSDLENNITKVSPSACQQFGYKESEFLKLNIKDLYADEKEFLKIINEFETKGFFTGQINNKTKKGEIFTTYLSSTSLKNDKNEIIGFMGISRDISEEKKATEMLQKQNSKLESIFESNSDILIWTMDEDMCVTSINSKFRNYAREIFKEDLLLGENFLLKSSPFVPKGEERRMFSFYGNAVKGIPQQFEVPLLKNNKIIWIETFLSPIKKENSEKFDLACIAIDTTEKKNVEIEIKKSLEEKDVLLKEVHHRVKNNLQVISSILNLQSAYVKDEGTLSILRESQNRVKSMSFIHESLYKSKDFSEVNFAEYITNLSNNVFHTFIMNNRSVKLQLDLDQINLNLDQAIPCGLIINELITNAMKYAFVNDDGGILYVKLKENKGKINICIEDNGIGLPENFNVEEAESLGLQLVYTLIEQLDGTISLKEEKGTKYLITFVKIT